MSSEPEHARLSPSSAHRWKRCPGSARTDLLDDSSEEADRGTELHAIAAWRLATKDDRGPYELTADEASLVDEYVEYVHGLPGEKHYEQRIYSELEPEHWGTVDCVAVTDDALHVVDFKSGRWRVDADDNDQLMSYLCLARERFGSRDHYYGTIVQPLLGRPQFCEFQSYELDRHERDVWYAAKHDYLQAGEWCHFCPLALACVTRQAYDKGKLDAAFDDDHPNVQWCQDVIAMADVVAKRKEAAERRLLELAIKGVEVPGKRVAMALSNRSWTDEEEVCRLLEEREHAEGEIYTPRKLRSPAQLEKIVDKAFVAKYTERKERGPTLVPLSSSLPDFKPPTPEVFADES